jgi:hypothetical protein
LYSDQLVSTMAGSAVNATFVPFDEKTEGLKQLKEDLDAYQPGASSKLDSSVIAGYASTDMFIQALKTVSKKGKSAITPENIQKTASRQTWSIEGLAGPTAYPNATLVSYPACTALVLSDGTAWKTTVPYSCSKKQYKISK